MTQPLLRIRLTGSAADIARTVKELERVFDVIEQSPTYDNKLDKVARLYLVIRPPEARKLVGRRI